MLYVCASELISESRKIVNKFFASVIFIQAEGCIRVPLWSRELGEVYRRQALGRAVELAVGTMYLGSGPSSGACCGDDVSRFWAVKWSVLWGRSGWHTRLHL